MLPERETGKYLLKRMIMKRLAVILTAVALLAAWAPAWADNERPVSVEELPATAQQFLKSHFSQQEISYAKADEGIFDKEYTVYFTDGTKVEFAKSGEWKQVDCKYNEVPSAIVPQQIRDYADSHFRGRKINNIERGKRGYEVELDNGVDLTFDKQLRFVKMDD